MKIQELTGRQKQNLRKGIGEAVKVLELLERSKAEYHDFIYKVALDTRLAPETVKAMILNNQLNIGLQKNHNVPIDDGMRPFVF